MKTLAQTTKVARTIPTQFAGLGTAPVVYGIHHIYPNDKAHFFLVIDGRDFGGCMHNEALEHYPELKPFVDLHCSDFDGVPVHAAENAKYWAGLTRWEPRSIPRLANHLRITEELAKTINTTEDIDNMVEALRPIWKQEAESALVMLDTVPTTPQR